MRSEKVFWEAEVRKNLPSASYKTKCFSKVFGSKKDQHHPLHGYKGLFDTSVRINNEGGVRTLKFNSYPFN
jgi:hypothetical protein